MRFVSFTSAGAVCSLWAHATKLCNPPHKIQALLEPTAQVVHMARAAGFSNVHDYLVHLVTGEKEEVRGAAGLHGSGGAVHACSLVAALV